jgi:tetratricopeptide (TPR) repeat protein
MRTQEPERTLGCRAIAPRVDRLGAVRELLRQLGRRQRLRRDPITSRYAASLGPDGDRQVLAPFVEEALRESMGALPARVRAVLERAEIEGQPIRGIARSLGISVRQAYRDRARALLAVYRHLSAASLAVPQPSAWAHPITDVGLAHARMLAEVGQLDASAKALADIAAASRDPGDRAGAYSALASLALERGSSSDARLHAEQALSSALAADDNVVVRCEADSVLGELALRHGRADTASQMLRRAAVGLRTMLNGTRHERAAETLARVLILLSVSQTAAGRFSDAWATIEEAQTRLSDVPRSSYLLELEARVQKAAVAHFLNDDCDRAEAELRACYAIAASSGFTLNALNIAIYLATFYRLRGARQLALDVMQPLVAVCERVSASRTKATFYASYATLLSSAGQTILAADMLALATQSTLAGQPDLEGQLHLVSARTSIARGLPHEAINASTKAQILFAELGRTGLIGVCLHMRALALIALGRRREALGAARDALDALAMGHPQARFLARETLTSLRSSGR